MKKVKSFLRSDKRCFLYTLLFTVLVSLLLALRLKIYPFGDHDLKYADCDQYFGFYGYLQSAFFTKSNLLYSWSKVLGDGFLSTYAYYAASPFNLLLVFFRSNLPAGVLFIAFLKTVLTSFNFCYLLNDFDKDHCLAKALFSTSYAFIGYVTFFSWNASWMDGVLFLPLLLLGMKKMLLENKNALYIVVLAVNLISNFYIGYMLCVATVIFYFIYLIESRGEFWQRLKGTFLRYAVCSLLAVGLAAFLLIPAYLGIPSGRKVSIKGIIKDLHFTFKALDIFPMFYTGALKLEDESQNMPVIFVGIAQFVLLLSFFLNSKISYRKKMVSGFLCLVFFFSFQLSTVNVAWHGFSVNAWFNYRYSFIFSFVLMLIAYYAFCNFSSEAHDLYKTIIVFLGLTAFVFYTDRSNFSAFSITGDVVAGVGSLLLVYVMKYYSPGSKRICECLLSLVILANMGINSYSSMHEGVGGTSISYYKNTKGSYDSLASEIKDSDFYRLADSDRYGRCEASQFNYAGIADYASTENLDTLNLVKKFGMNHSWMWAQYNVNSPESSDDLLGIRYLISSKTPSNKDYEVVAKSDNGTKLYKNKNALPLIYPTDSFVDTDVSELNDFKLMNSYWEGLSGNEYGEVFTTIKPILKKEVTDSGEKITVHIDGTDPEKRLYIQIPYSPQMQITLNDGTAVNYSDGQEIYFIPVNSKSDSIDIELNVTGTIDEDNIYCTFENKDTVSKLVKNELRKSSEVFENSSSSLELNVKNSTKQKYSSSIPYSQDWNVRVDNRVVPTVNSGSFLAFTVSAGSHKISLTYEPKGLKIGIIISIISLVIFIAAEVLKKNYSEDKRRTSKLNSLIEKYKDLIPYAIFGVLTTLVNIGCYWLCAHPLGLPVMASTIIAWFASVLFAYLTNRKWVFHSEAVGAAAIWKEIISFFACRIGTELIDLAFMFIFVDKLGFNDMVIKVIANVVVIIVNYIASKFVIFRHSNSENS